jgi:hypothetical protein
MPENELAQRQYLLGLLNRRIAAHAAQLDDTYAHITGKSGIATLFCACAREECERPSVRVPLQEYARVRASPHRFVVAPGHAAEIDVVIDAREGYEIVEIKPEYRSPDPLTDE